MFQDFSQKYNKITGRKKNEWMFCINSQMFYLQKLGCLNTTTYLTRTYN